MIELLDQIFTKFPVEVLNQNSQYFFVPLVLALCNEEDIPCRNGLAQATKHLLEYLDFTHARALYDLTKLWATQHEKGTPDIPPFSDNLLVNVRSAATVTIGYFVEILGSKLYGAPLNWIFSHVDTILTTEVSLIRDQTEEQPTSTLSLPAHSHALDDWKLSYNSLCTLEKCLTSINDFVTDKQFLPLLKSVIELLAHPHNWIRTVASRIVGFCFGHAYEQLPQLSDDNMDLDQISDDIIVRYFFAQGTLFRLIRLSIFQLNSKYLNPKISDQIVKNLVFLGSVLATFPHLNTQQYQKPPVDDETQDKEYNR
jgi:hypothetical protein